MIEDFYKTTDTSNMPVSNQQQKLINKDIQFVKGSDFYKGYYDKDVTTKIFIRYFQLAIFEEHGKKAIRSYLFEGISSNGACFFNYKILEIKNYNIKSTDLDKFVKQIENKKSINTPNGEIKIMFKYYPVYNFNYQDPPDGNELSQCQSELLNY